PELPLKALPLVLARRKIGASCDQTGVLDETLFELAASAQAQPGQPAAQKQRSHSRLGHGRKRNVIIVGGGAAEAVVQLDDIHAVGSLYSMIKHIYTVNFKGNHGG